MWSSVLGRITAFPFRYQAAYVVTWVCGMMSGTHLILASRALG